MSKVVFLFLILITSDTFALSSEEILKKIDQIRAPGDTFVFDLKITYKKEGKEDIIQKFAVRVKDADKSLVKFTYPAIYKSIAVEGVRLEFKKGKVVKATADKNEAFLLKTLETDEGASFLGELGIGTNFGIQRFTKSILYDEKIGGTFHLAVGNGFPRAGGKNKSIVHWDLICDAKQDTEMRVDGELFYQNGKFVV